MALAIHPHLLTNALENNLDLRTASDVANEKMQRFRACNIRRSFPWYEGIFRPVETDSIQLFLPQI